MFLLFHGSTFVPTPSTIGTLLFPFNMAAVCQATVVRSHEFDNVWTVGRIQSYEDGQLQNACR